MMRYDFDVYDAEKDAAHNFGFVAETDGKAMTKAIRLCREHGIQAGRAVLHADRVDSAEVGTVEIDHGAYNIEWS